MDAFTPQPRPCWIAGRPEQGEQALEVSHPFDGTEVASGKIVDIFTAVPCGETSNQAWEDGGSRVPEPISDADFFYSVTGKCDLNQRPSDSLLTQ